MIIKWAFNLKLIGYTMKHIKITIYQDLILVKILSQSKN